MNMRFQDRIIFRSRIDSPLGEPCFVQQTIIENI